MKKNELIKQVCNWWEQNYDEDISTERLLEMCRSEFNLDDASDVVDLLIESGVFGKGE